MPKYYIFNPYNIKEGYSIIPKDKIDSIKLSNNPVSDKKLKLDIKEGKLVLGEKNTI